MVYLGLTADFKRQVLQWNSATVHMRDPRYFLGKSDLTKHEMREVVMQTAEPASTQEDTERILKILDITYAKGYLEQVFANSIQLNAEEITLLLCLLEDFEYLLGGTLGDWATELVNLELNTYSNQFNSIY